MRTTGRKKTAMLIPAGLACATIFYSVYSACVLTAKEREDRAGALERKNQELVRSSGFQDIEIERLHAQLAKQLQALAGNAVPEMGTESGQSPGQVPGQAPSPSPQPSSTQKPRPPFKSITGETAPFLVPSRERSFVTGKDQEGRTYYRLRLKEGLNFTSEPRPDRFIFRAHAYLYLNQAGTGLDRIVLQFYRIRFSGMQYIREIRRIVHPGPFGPGASNAEITLEFRRYEDGFPGSNLTVDGVPRPVLAGEPELRTKLHSPDEPMSFDKQSRILETYRSLLRKLERQMGRELEMQRLERNSDIERAMDFTGTSF